MEHLHYVHDCLNFLYTFHFTFEMIKKIYNNVGNKLLVLYALKVFHFNLIFLSYNN